MPYNIELIPGTEGLALYESAAASGDLWQQPSHLRKKAFGLGPQLTVYEPYFTLSPSHISPAKYPFHRSKKTF